MRQDPPSTAPDLPALIAAAQSEVAVWGADGPGGAILGFTPDEILFSASGGLESIASGKAFSPETLTRFASITKHVLCAMVLEHPEALDLDQPLSRYLPELRACGAVTVSQALGMTGGLPDTREALALQGIAGAHRTDKAPLLQFMAEMEALNFAPGTETSYSNSGYRLVEAALERQGLSFDAYVQRRLTTELGHPMRACELWDDPVPGLAEGYWPSPTGWRIGRQGMHMAAAGSLCGSALGLASWLQQLMGPRAGLLERLARPQRLLDGRSTRYGLGLMHMRFAGREMLGHSGSQAGYKALFVIDPAAQIGLVIVSNREDSDCGAIARRLLNAAWAAEEPPAQPGPWATPGIYVAAEGTRWVEVRPGGLSHYGSEEMEKTLPGPGLTVESPTTPVTLALEDSGALVGEIGYAPVRLLPAAPEAGPDLSAVAGLWEAGDTANRFRIDGAGILHWGIGAQRQACPLQPLGHGRWLFTLRDEPWATRIFLHLTQDGGVELATARARHIRYRRCG